MNALMSESKQTDGKQNRHGAGKEAQLCAQERRQHFTHQKRARSKRLNTTESLFKAYIEQQYLQTNYSLNLV